MIKKLLELINQEKISNTKKDETKPHKTLMGFNNILDNKKYVLIGLSILGTILFILSIIAINSIYNIRNIIPFTEHKQFKLSDVLPFYFISFIVILICLTILFFKIRTSFKDLNVGQKGADRLMTLEEIQETYLEIDEKDTRFEGIGGLPVARFKDKLYIDNRINNNFTVSLTRGGKGELLGIPSCDILSRAETQTSMIIHDLKDGELSRANTPKLIDRGYTVKILNFVDSTKSNHINLLYMATQYYKKGKVTLAQQICSIIAYAFLSSNKAEEDVWINSSIALFTAVCLAHITDCVKSGEEEKINLYSVTLFIKTLSSIETTNGSALDDYFKNRDFFDTARLIYSSIEFSKGRTRASILFEIFSKLELFTYDDVFNVTTTNDVDLEYIGFGDRPTALFIRLPQNNKKYYPIVSAVFSLIYFILTTRSQQEVTEEEKGTRQIGECKIPVKFVGDEIFNGAKIEDLHQKLSMCLSAKISFDLYAQSFEQVEATYGKTFAPIILDNCSTKILIATDSQKTLEMFAKMTGQKTIQNISRSGDRFDLDKKLTETFESREVVPTYRLARLKEGEILVCQTLKRRTLNGEDIISRPILTTDELRMKFRYEYLKEFNPKATLPANLIDYGKPIEDIKNYIYIPEKYQKQIFKPKNKELSMNLKNSIIATLKSNSIEIDVTSLESLENAKNLINSISNIIPPQRADTLLFMIENELNQKDGD